jgi:hypothetical protein
MTGQAARARRTALYRMFDADNILLYIGISCQPGTRWDQELRTAP